jgi:hypothetical protein
MLVVVVSVVEEVKDVVVSAVNVVVGSAGCEAAAESACCLAMYSFMNASSSDRFWTSGDGAVSPPDMHPQMSMMQKIAFSLMHIH